MFKFRFWDTKEKTWARPSQFEFDSEGQIFDLYNENDRYVIQQTIGLKDSSGVDIFEGDIVKNLSIDEEYCSPALVIRGEYEEVSFALAFRPRPDVIIPPELIRNTPVGKLHEEFIIRYQGTYEVVGNVFENPELLDKSDYWF